MSEPEYNEIRNISTGPPKLLTGCLRLYKNPNDSHFKICTMNELPDLQEEMRLADLYSFGILDSEDEEDFTQLVELAANITNCQMAAISFIDKDRQWFKAIKNIGTKQTTRDVAFCRYTIQQDGIMLVPDAKKDPRFQDNPLVNGEPHIHFYAGAPIRSSSGHKLGRFMKAC